MVDRVIVYDGALPQTTDVLNTNKFGLISESYQNRSILGTSTVVAGLACTPTSPTADLHVNVNVGAIYQMDPTDAAAYGDLGTDTNNIVKQGILQTAVQLTVTPPGTVGFSQVYLVQAILNDVDAGTVVLSYYNSANPASPFSGPANSGTSNLTTRTCPCIIALKAGVPATTGTQSTPAPDAGYVGLYAITVANGQTQITSGNIAQTASAPFFPTLPAVPAGVQGGNWVYVGTDTGTANNYVISFGANQPLPTAYTAGMGIKFKAANACSGASVININGIGNANIRRASGIAVATGDIVSGQIVELTYDGTNFQMCNYIGSGSITNTNTNVSIPYIADTGALNAIIATFSPAITGGQQVAGLTVEVKLANTITGACTINVNGLGLKSVFTGDLANPPNGVYVAGEIIMLVYDGTQYQIVNTSSLTFRKPIANLTIFVNTSTGSDTLYDGTSSTVGSGTSGPLKTIGKAILVAFGYAPSQFTITIQVAAGTYNEAVSTPSYAGPNVIINGVSAASVLVNSGNNHAIIVSGPNTLTVQNLTVQSNNTNLWGGFVSNINALMYTSNTASNAIGGAVFYANGCSNLIVNGSHTFNGSSNSLYWAVASALIQIAQVTQTISTSISVASASGLASYGGIVAASSVAPPTYVNPSFVSGPKFASNFNGIINTAGLGLNFFPGTSAGTTQTGGQVSS